MSQPFKRALGPFDATMIVIGGIIGSGIFINPYIVAQRLDSSALVLGAWVAGAAIALIGALAYAELGAMSPAAGGQYVYLRDAYHPLIAFLYGWALLFMI
jgi:APA family basic amino acid/polyamine antiporter